MEQCKIDFTSIPWEIPAKGARFKAYKQNGKQVRLVEFTDELVETDWCTEGHIVYILEGQLEVNFNGNMVVFNKGDGLFIPASEKNKHIGKALTKVVKMIIVEDVL
ncbi:MAG: cupin domain-containing protein [ANME-2 cluster archaeon]|nr:cupin domain-containing protein [ANME-2 cluster archaeon]MBC2702288.1 cupin domain-containing protein [ANME-2 cluster archaeon]MBC2708523.1 cupin domain-containing protein [ANME-2 cluster archaeon]MBC2748453.1 cupin domain-containing protein [ANME-2 cluster archaeon]